MLAGREGGSKLLLRNHLHKLTRSQAQRFAAPAGATRASSGLPGAGGNTSARDVSGFGVPMATRPGPQGKHPTGASRHTSRDPTAHPASRTVCGAAATAGHPTTHHRSTRSAPRLREGQRTQSGTPLPRQRGTASSPSQHRGRSMQHSTPLPCHSTQGAPRSPLRGRPRCIPESVLWEQNKRRAPLLHARKRDALDGEPHEGAHIPPPGLTCHTSRRGAPGPVTGFCYSDAPHTAWKPRSTRSARSQTRIRSRTRPRTRTSTSAQGQGGRPSEQGRGALARDLKAGAASRGTSSSRGVSNATSACSPWLVRGGNDGPRW